MPQPVFALTPLPSISATQVALLPGVPYQPNTPPDINGLPPHLLMTFDNQPVTPDYFNPNEPQARLFPVPAYLDMYAQAGDPYVAERIQQLSQLIAEKPAVSTPPLPVLPGINAAQALVAQVQYLDFTGGSGVAFLAYYTQDASPLTNQSLLYFFQGLTTDGNWYVSMAFPIDSAVLPDTAADVPADAVQQATEDNAAYLQEVTQALNEAAPGDFTPPLDQLNAMAASIIVQSAAEPTANSGVASYIIARRHLSAGDPPGYSHPHPHAAGLPAHQYSPPGCHRRSQPHTHPGAGGYRRRHLVLDIPAPSRWHHGQRGRPGPIHALAQSGWYGQHARRLQHGCRVLRVAQQ